MIASIDDFAMGETDSIEAGVQVAQRILIDTVTDI
jgi:hypothetical protein